MDFGKPHIYTYKELIMARYPAHKLFEEGAVA